MHSTGPPEPENRVTCVCRRRRRTLYRQGCDLGRSRPRCHPHRGLRLALPGQSCSRPSTRSSGPRPIRCSRRLLVRKLPRDYLQTVMLRKCQGYMTRCREGAVGGAGRAAGSSRAAGLAEDRAGDEVRRTGKPSPFPVFLCRPCAPLPCTWGRVWLSRSCTRWWQRRPLWGLLAGRAAVMAVRMGTTIQACWRTPGGRCWSA